MKHAVRTEAINVLEHDAKLGNRVAEKIVNYCEGVLVSVCLPYSWLAGSIVVYLETTDGRKFEKVFNQRGSFRYNRKAK